MTELATVLAGWLLTIATAWCLGWALLARLGLPLTRAESALFAFLAGAPLLSTTVFLLALAHLAYPAVFVVVALGAVLLAGRSIRRAKDIPVTAGTPVSWRRAGLFIYAVYALIYLVYALPPDVSPDGSAYHLGLVTRLLSSHRWPWLPTNFQSHLPSGAEMLFAFAFWLGRSGAAALVHCTFLLILPLLWWVYGQRIGQPTAGLVGGLLLFTMPVAGAAGTASYNDLAVAATLSGLFIILRMWREDQRPAYAALAGLLAGFCCAVKLTAGLAIPYAIGVVLWHGRLRRKPLLLLLATTAAICGPWVIKNTALTGNPAAPFANRLFPNPDVHISFEEGLPQSLKNLYGFHEWREWPWEVTVRGARLQGFIGPVFLLSPLALFACRQRAGRSLLLAALLFALPYPVNLGTRFLLPSLVFLTLALAFALPKRSLPWVLSVAILTTFPAIAARYCDEYAWRLGPWPWRAAFRMESEEAYLRTRLPRYAMVQFLRQQVPPGGRIFGLTGVPDAYCSREQLLYFQGAENERLYDVLRAAVVPYLQPAWQRTFAFPLQPLRALRLVQTATSPENSSISELHLSPPAAYRLDADPFRWDGPFAHDQNPATRWRAWQTAVPGQSITITLSNETKLNGLRLDCTHDQWLIRWRLEGLTPEGWRRLAETSADVSLPTTADLRPDTAREFRRSGVQFILVEEKDLLAADLEEHQNAWRARLLGTRDGIRLYRLE